MGSLLEVNDKDFAAKVLENPSPVLVDFWATWCMPCTQMSLVLEQVTTELPKLAIFKMNIDENAVVPAEHNIMSIPTLVLFEEGKAVGRWTGLTDAETLAQWVRDHASKLT